VWNRPSTAKPPFSSLATLTDQRLLNWYSPWTISLCGWVTWVEKEKIGDESRQAHGGDGVADEGRSQL
jgi:hypothetical protein